MAHAHGAVLQVAVVKAKAGIEKDFRHAVALGDFDLAREIVVHHRHRVGGEIELADFADVFSLNVTDDDGGIVRGDHAEQFVAAVVAGEVEDVRSGFEAGARDGGLVGFHRDKDVRRPQLADDGKELGVLRRVVQPRRVGERGFRAHVHDVRALRCEGFTARHCAFGREADALAIPRVGGEVDDAHDGRAGIEGEWFAAYGKLRHAHGGGGAVALQQLGKLFEFQHGWSSSFSLFIRGPNRVGTS